MVDLCSSLAYISMMTHPLLVVSKLPIKTLVARQLLTNAHMYTHTHTHTHTHTQTHTQIMLNPAIAVFLSHSRDPPSSPLWQLPPTLSPFFRTFSLPVSDPTIVFRAQCMALGLKASKGLANKLTNLQTMARKQL